MNLLQNGWPWLSPITDGGNEVNPSDYPSDDPNMAGQFRKQVRRQACNPKAVHEASHSAIPRSLLVALVVAFGREKSFLTLPYKYIKDEGHLLNLVTSAESLTFLGKVSNKSLRSWFPNQSLSSAITPRSLSLGYWLPLLGYWVTSSYPNKERMCILPARSNILATAEMLSLSLSLSYRVPELTIGNWF